MLRRESAAVEKEALLTKGSYDEFGVQGDPPMKAFSDCAALQQAPIRSTLVELSEILRGFRLDETNFMSTIFLASLAEGYGQIGEIETALEKIADALTLVETSSEREREAELYRLKGVLLQKRDVPNRAEAEACFRQAIEVARRQAAKSFELRATTSLARLLAKQGRRDEARTMLKEIYCWFNRGL
jgi:tetratricopeptide (TPR) repeat protein